MRKSLPDLGSPGAVIVGGFVNGLGLVRALASRRIPTAVVRTKRYDVAHLSRWVSGHDTVLDVEESPDRLAELLERRATEWRGRAVLPANDGALAALAQTRDRLASTYRVVAPPEDQARFFLDKQAMYAAARGAGIDLPHCYGEAASSTTVPPDAFPVAVKPRFGYRFSSRFGCKLFVARDPSELRQCIARVTAAGMPADVFDWIPGPDSQIYAYCTYIDARGEPRGGLTVRKLRQSPPFCGVARVAELAGDIPGVREATVELLRRFGYRGIAAAEFKLDPRDGRLRFIEVNGRSVIYNGLLRRGGLDLAALAWSDYVLGRPETATTEPWPGVWIHLHADVLYSALRRRLEPISLRQFLAPYRRPKTYAVWAADDPLPFLAEWSRTAWEGASSLLGSRATTAAP